VTMYMGSIWCVHVPQCVGIFFGYVVFEKNALQVHMHKHFIKNTRKTSKNLYI